MARRKRTHSRGLRGFGPAKRKKKTGFQQLQEDAATGGLYVARWSPGDGVTRYRFFDKPGNDYFGPANGICTALGMRSAVKFLQTGTCPRGKSSR